MLELYAGDAAITGLAFARSANLLAVAIGGRHVETWNLARPDARIARTHRPMPELAMTFGRDDRLIVLNRNYMAAVDPQTGRLVGGQTSGMLSGRPGGFAVSPDGEQAVVVCRQLDVGGRGYTCWRVVDRPWSHVWTAATLGDGTGRAVAFLGTGTHVVAAEDGRQFPPDRVTQGVLVVMDAATGELVKQHTTPVKRLTAVAAHPTGRQTVVAGGAVLSVWDDPVTGSYTRRVDNDGRKHFTAVAYHPGGRLLAATSNDETVKLYDTSTWRVARTFTWAIGKLRSVAFSPDGTRAAVGGDAGRVLVWDVDD